ncbi:MAG TPA: enoyl-CoA hydratase/isomerase family protein [Solirubrobacteraceae bacterium]|nr:enoyl-CoA hydratase/isomerase family protein [Solirubrobacteraceae bacterium]
MDSLQIERAGDGIAVLRLDRPQARNALGSEQLAELEVALGELAADPAVAALVVSTTDVRALCAGADVAERLGADAAVARMEAFARVYAALDALAAPTVAVCVGHVVGAGAEIAAGCDLRVGGDNLRLVWAGARMGAPVGPARLVPLVGLSRAKELILTGRVVGMEEARAIGFLHRTARPGAAEDVALALAREVTAHSGEGLRALKAMFRELESLPARVARENELLVAWQRHGAGLPSGGVRR